MHLPRPRCHLTNDSSLDTDLWQTCALEVIRGYYIGDAPQGMLGDPGEDGLATGGSEQCPRQFAQTPR